MVCDHNSLEQYSENVLLAYFTEISQKVKCSTVWSQSSMNKSGTNIEKCLELRVFRKQQNESYIPKKARVLINQDSTTVTKGYIEDSLRNKT